MGKKNRPREHKRPALAPASSSDGESDDSELQAEKRALAMGSSGDGGQAKVPLDIYDKDALTLSLKSFSLHAQGQLPWKETLDVTLPHSAADTVDDAHDDLKREMSFYAASLNAVLWAQAECDKLHIPHKRPDDFMAEMAKSDDHMQKVRGKLLAESKGAAQQEERKKQRQQKVFGKEVQTKKLQEKEQAKKHAVDSVTQWRKDRKSGRVQDGTFDLDNEGPKRGGAAGRGGKRDDGRGGKAGRGSDLPQKSFKRQAKDNKYSRGGKEKKAAKRNTSESSRDVSDFDPRKNRQPAPGLARKTSGISKGRGGGRGGRGGRR